MTGAIAHHAAQGPMYPLAAPGSVPKKAPLPWDAAHPFRGLGYCEVEAWRRIARPALLAAGLAVVIGSAGGGRIAERSQAVTAITITAHRFAYEPNLITVKKGEPVTIELGSSDRLHGFVLAA